MSRDDAAVGDVQQAVFGFDAHRLSREVATDVVAVLENAVTRIVTAQSRPWICRGCRGVA
jgi:hypothetical protein